MRKAEIFWIGGGNWAIPISGTLSKKDPSNNNLAINDKIIEINVTQNDKTIYQTFKKTGQFGNFSTLFTPPSDGTAIITAKLVDDNSSIQETISVIVTQSILPLTLIAILLFIAIAIIAYFWTRKGTKFRNKLITRNQHYLALILAAIPIIVAFMILSSYPIYDTAGNSAIATALVVPIAGYIIELLKERKNP